MKIKQPSTSIEAYRRTAEMQLVHHAKIIVALEFLRQGTYEEIAVYLGMDKHQIGRRLKEIGAVGMIYRTGEQRPTSTGCNAFVWRLVGVMRAKTTTELLASIKKYNQAPTLF